MQLPVSSFLLCDHSNRMMISSVLAPVSRENMTMEIMSQTAATLYRGNSVTSSRPEH